MTSMRPRLREGRLARVEHRRRAVRTLSARQNREPYGAAEDAGQRRDSESHGLCAAHADPMQILPAAGPDDVEKKRRREFVGLGRVALLDGGACYVC